MRDVQNHPTRELHDTRDELMAVNERAAVHAGAGAGNWRRWLEVGPSLGAAEICLWCLVAALALLLRAQVVGGPHLSNDSYQYLVTAENFRRGELAATSIVHFDAERTHGRIPAPLTTFPAGYSALIALFSAAGLSGEHGGLLLSMLATIAVVAMFGWAAGLLGMAATTARVLIALLVTSSSWLVTGNAVITEALFTAMTFGALLVLMAAESRERSDRDYVLLQLAANALIAGAFWVRYAGLFLFAATASFHALRWLATRARRPLYAITAMSVSAALIGAGLWRNHVLVGSWKGGNTKEVQNAILELLYRFARTVHHLFLGDRPAEFGMAEAVLALALVVILATGLRALWRSRAAVFSDPRMQLLATYIAVYTCAMLYLGARSVISFGPRMFVPLLPVLLLFIGGLCRNAAPYMSWPPQSRRVLRGVPWMLVVAYAAVNLRFLLEDPGVMSHQEVQARLGAPVAAGESLRDWLEREVRPEATLVATDGQATGYVLQRKVLSLVFPPFSDQLWTEDAVREAMTRFGARHLLVYHGSDESDALARSAFLNGLAGGSTPAWLHLLADNGRAKLFGSRDIEWHREGS
jgi:hypothetical protein